MTTIIGIMNIGFTVYFAHKKYYWAAIFYAFASALLLCMAFITSSNPDMVDASIGILGLDNYNYIHYTLLEFAPFALEPMAAISVLGLICCLVVAISTAERIVVLISKAHNHSFARKSCHKLEKTRLSYVTCSHKIYLSFCVMRC